MDKEKAKALSKTLACYKELQWNYRNDFIWRTHCNWRRSNVGLKRIHVCYHSVYKIDNNYVSRTCLLQWV